MKKSIATLIFVLVTNMVFSQTEKEVIPESLGENFSLEGALTIFKKVKSIEEFEKSINDETSNVNNLDLNNDGKIDYVVVEDIKENNTHAIVLSVYLDEKEKQDIAVIGIEKTGENEAILQIIGNDELYAANTIVEPFDVDEKIDNSGKGPAYQNIETDRIIVNVWLWPSVQFIYSPNYVIWVSPYRWGVYPTWWRPWRPYGYTVFYSRCAPHRVYYHRVPTTRVVVAKSIYAPRRSSSKIVVHSKRGTTVVKTNKRGRTTVVKTNSRVRKRY